LACPRYQGKFDCCQSHVPDSLRYIKILPKINTYFRNLRYRINGSQMVP
jgi:hypothetical protein